MKKYILPLLVAAALLGVARVSAMLTPAKPKPVKIIFDTDIGNDCDDVMALAVIHALQNRGATELLAVTLTNPVWSVTLAKPVYTTP